MSFFHSHKDHSSTHKHSSPDHQHGPMHDSSHSPLAHHHNYAASPAHHPSLHQHDAPPLDTSEDQTTSTSFNSSAQTNPTYASTDPTTTSSASTTSKLAGNLKGMAQGVTGSIQAAVGTTFGQKGMAEKGFEKMSAEDARLAAKSGKAPIGAETRSTTVGAEELAGGVHHGRGS